VRVQTSRMLASRWKEVAERDRCSREKNCQRGTAAWAGMAAWSPWSQGDYFVVALAI
jgi:hypothetical protein